MRWFRNDLGSLRLFAFCQGLPPWYVARQQQGRVQYVTPQPPSVVQYPQSTPATHMSYPPVPQWHDKPSRLVPQSQPHQQYIGIPPVIQEMVAAVAQRHQQPSRPPLPPPTVMYAPPSITPTATPMVPVSVSRGGSVTASAPQYQVFDTTMRVDSTPALPLPLADPSHSTPTPPPTYVMITSPSAGTPSQLPHPLIVMQPSLTPQILPDPIYEETTAGSDNDDHSTGRSESEEENGGLEVNPTVGDRTVREHMTFGAAAATGRDIPLRNPAKLATLPQEPPLPRLAPESEPGVGQGRSS